MASNRHLGRIIALQSLYEFDFRTQVEDPSVQLEEILQRNLQQYAAEIKDSSFVEGLVYGTQQYVAEIDTKLQPLAPEWPIQQIARVDHAILRLALYELLYCSDSVPPKVVINEAVELAKSFGSDNSSKFVNGVLGTAYRTLVGDTNHGDAV